MLNSYLDEGSGSNEDDEDDEEQESDVGKDTFSFRQPPNQCDHGSKRWGESSIRSDTAPQEQVIF